MTCPVCKQSNPLPESICDGCGAPPALRREAAGLDSQALFQLQLRHGHTLAHGLREALEDWNDLMASHNIKWVGQ